MVKRKTKNTLRAMAALLVMTSAAAMAAEKAEPETLEDYLFGGKVNFNLRMRFESVEQEGADLGGSQAWTERLRMGYQTHEWNGLSGYFEFEDIRTADDDRYFDGTNNANKALIADPEDTELNQAYLQYVNDFLTFRGGRQRIQLDDERFVGNVGWRQNEQTYDSLVGILTPCENLTFIYGYVWDVNTIWGPDADMDLEVEVHALNLSYANIPFVGKVTGFAYILDVDTAAAASSNTYGIRVAGANDLNDQYTLNHVFSFANQEEADDNPVGYDAEYYLVEGSLAKKDLGYVGSGFEVLGSEEDSMGNKTGFQTPLATHHAHNGWADAFAGALGTPGDGLEDFYLFAGATLPFNIEAKVYHHWFRANDDGGRLGEEVDFVMSKKVTDNITCLAKLAEFNGREQTYADRTKVWLQVELTY